jgi:hypothetical protein
MNRETRKILNEKKQRLVDFFYVYFDEKTSKKVRNHPDLAVPLIREEIAVGIPSRSRLTVYAEALRDALEYQVAVLAAEMESH